jgi:hypothetical protein
VGLEYVQTQHPPDKKKRDCRNYDVANPLSSGLWLGAIGHRPRITPGLAALFEFVEWTPDKHLRHSRLWRFGRTERALNCPLPVTQTLRSSHSRGICYFMGENSVESMKTDSILRTSLPFASVSFRTLCHSGSLRNASQFFFAASRPGCART